MQNKIVKGTLVRWRDDKGFGFIEPEQVNGEPKSQDVFIHASRLTHMSRRPLEGDIIFFQIEHKPDGKLNAIEAHIDGVEVKSDLEHNSKTKKGLRSQQRDVATDRRKTNKVSDHSDSPTRGILYRIGIMMLLLAGASFAYNRVVNSSGTGNNPSDSVTHIVAASTGSAVNLDSRSLGSTDSGVVSLAKAYQDKLNGVQVRASGTVITLLEDDNEGSRHQRFILRLSNNQTLLVAHNIDLAPRIESISLGDKVEFAGQYEFNNKGGVVHWTHDDPQARHPGGWLKHDGQIYK
ncbi:DUF3465 domain-containing protein [Shewanella sp. D64]|uniref:DUF3465 domain-containing protein n=1 Tax=unclassified Shewanella TaxID=196818 RepID=UPI0022BA1D21|nr:MULTISPECIES: DUF3465 domain-containing protein [unclassified Shewanella]MEC4727695.1 DUF3465 domain-containing protein [Shewanella sp. D64]MEC4739732.1 DUF3465 domain-containing protein [Shewanella sp. E94]WBJ94090.1 DUF3465 domain-containing protein [Shewanella sp. MTB7]